MTGQELGILGELYVTRMLSSAGILTCKGGLADLLADGVRVEVKAARRSQYARGKRGYQFCLHAPGRKGFQGDVLVLLCYWKMGQDPGAFIIPASDVGQRKSITICGQPWTYAGRWAPFYDDWTPVGEAIEGTTYKEVEND